MSARRSRAPWAFVAAVAAVVALALPASAQREDPVICNTYAARWESVAAEGDRERMRTFIAQLPPECQNLRQTQAAYLRATQAAGAEPAQSARPSSGSPLSLFNWFLIALGAVATLTLAGALFVSRKQGADAYARRSRVWPIATVALGASWAAWTFAHGAFPAAAPSPPAFVANGAVYLFFACASAMVGGTLRTAWLSVLLFLLAGALSVGGPLLATAAAQQGLVSKALFASLALALLAITGLAMRRARGNWLLPLISLPAAIMYGALLAGVQLPLVELVTLIFAAALWCTAFKRIFWPPADVPAARPYSVRRVIRSLAAARLPLAIAAAGALAALALQTHRESAVRALSPHGAPITAMAFSQDGAWLAVASEDGEIRVWPTRGGRPHRIVNPDGPARQLIFDTLSVEEDGAQVRRQRLLFATAMGYVRGVDAETGAPLLADDAVPVSFGVPLLEAETPADGQPLATIVAATDNAGAPVIFRLHEGEASTIAIAPDGPAFARLTSLARLADPGVVAASTARGELVIIRAGSALTSVTDIPASNNVALYALTQNIVGFVGDEVRVESRNSSAEVTWRTLEQIGACPGDFLARFAPPRSRDGFVAFAQVVTSAGRICVATDQGERVGFESRQLAEAPTAAAFTRDGAMVLGFADGSVRLADASGAFGGRLGGHGGRVTVIALSPDGRHAATAAADGSVQFIDLAPSAAPVYAIPNAMAETADREGRRQWAAMLDRIAPPPVMAATAEHPGFAMLREAGLAGPYSDESIGCQFSATASDTQIASVRRALDAFNASLLRDGDPTETAAENLGAGCALLALGGADNIVEAIRHFELASATAPAAEPEQPAAVTPEDAAAQDRAARNLAALSAEERAYMAATQLNTVASYEDYIRRFPNGRNRADVDQRLARARIFEMSRRAQEPPTRTTPRQEATTTTTTAPPTRSVTAAERPSAEADRAAWSAASRRDTIEGYSAYLAQYPEGQFARQAGARIAQLRVAERPQPPEPQQ